MTIAIVVLLSLNLLVTLHNTWGLIRVKDDQVSIMRGQRALVVDSNAQIIPLRGIDP
jgi:hypothetical protein